MKRIILASKSINSVNDMLLSAYITLGKSMNWYENDMIECGDAFYIDDNHWRTECAKFILDHFDENQITNISIIDNDGELIIQIYNSGNLLGNVITWYSNGRFDFEAE